MFQNMKQNETILTPKNAKNANKYNCELCDFKCSKISDFKRHLSTRKHLLKQNETNETNLTPKNATAYECTICEKNFQSRTSLWRHKKKCFPVENKKLEDTKIDTTVTDDLVIKLVKQNSELQHKVLEICDQIPSMNSMNNSHNTYNNENNFNIQIFLDEKCKDAMNMKDFIESIQLSLEDLQTIQEYGQTKGMSTILVDKLNTLDVCQRPVHCSDAKKETIYVKDQDRWEKEEKDKPKLKHALDEITKKSIKSLSSVQNDPDTYLKVANEVLKDPREDKKIISDVAKEIVVK
jgi:hypothetical protein